MFEKYYNYVLYTAKYGNIVLGFHDEASSTE